MDVLIFIVLWLVLSATAGSIAESKGRSAAGYFFLSLIASPLVGILAVLVVGKNEEKLRERQLATGEWRRCPACAELVRIEATRCRYCASGLTPTATQLLALKRRISG